MKISNQELSHTLNNIINNTKIFDIHTHLFPSVFKSHSLSGLINLLNYHYLIAELLTNANISAEKFYSLDEKDKAKLIWKELFQNRTPISESCKGVLTVLQKFLYY
jgi:phosphoenolpyruvate carboxylase